MKKWIAMLLCLILCTSVFMLSGCDFGGSDEEQKSIEDQTPVEVYESAYFNFQDTTSYEVNVTMDISYQSDHVGMNYTQTVLCRVNGKNSYLKIDGNNLNLEAWYVDEVCYLSYRGTKIKKTITWEEYMREYGASVSSENTLLDIPESWFENVELKQEGEYFLLEFVINAEDYTEVLGDYDFEGEIIGNVTYTVYLSNAGELVKIVTALDMKYLGNVVTSVSTAVYQYSDFVITAPADADTFIGMKIGG